MQSGGIELESALDVEVSGNRMLAHGDQLPVVDVSDPRSPVVESRFGSGVLSFVEDASFQGNQIVYAQSVLGMRIIDAGGCVGCPADINGDGLFRFDDVAAYLAAFQNGDQLADFTGDGLLDFFDVAAFLRASSLDATRRTDVVGCRSAPVGRWSSLCSSPGRT